MSCTKNGARCESTHDMGQDTPECCRAKVLEVTRFLVRLLEQKGIRYWADYGTLLGAVRHGGMIPWDKDADLGCYAGDFQRVRQLGRHVRMAGYHFMLAGHRAKVRYSATNHNNVDLFFWWTKPNGTMYRKRYIERDNYKGREFHRSMIEPLRRVQFDGLELWAPNDPESFAEMRYGPDWRTPVRALHDGVRR